MCEPDFKCTLELIDHSIQDESYGIQISFFWPEENMPTISGPADIVLLRNVRAQMYQGAISLIAHKTTECHVLAATRVPTKALNSPTAQWQSFPPGKFRQPSLMETNYAIWAKSRSNEMDLPSDHEFHEKSMQAMTVKDKFSLLKNVKPEHFYNILGQVIKLHDTMNVMTLYLSDYTPHSSFYNNAWGGEGASSDAKDGDEYGYIKSRGKDPKAWPGPFGKMSIQLNLYDEHATYVREYVKVKQWVLLSNVQIKYGKMGGLLEGYLRGDRQNFEGKIQVQIMEKSEDPEGNDIRWKEAMKRSLEYWKKHEAQKKAILCEDDGLGNKRKAEDDRPVKLNSKQRRREKRAAAEKEAAASEKKLAEKLNLNDNVRCSFPDKIPTSLKVIMEPETLPHPGESSYPSPFTVRKYRANVRIVNYAPEKIEDFSVWRRESEYDMLSDYSGGEDTDVEEDMRSFTSGKGFAKKIWEWRFWLQVEDACSNTSPTRPEKRLWLLVDNSAAQGLLGLDDDAANLRRNPDLLARLKEQLFKLWGDLEEQKSELLRLHGSKVETLLPSSFESSTTPPRDIGQQPDVDSDSESDRLQSKTWKGKGKDKKRGMGDVLPPGASASDGELSNLLPRNKAFTCCIQQYGVKTAEDDPAKANAGDGRRWQRVFALFGTNIL
ncbi:hypothetical protein ONS95_009195 [Cadophora gregata]|uniref:uncharacterized protein n=1 Tax=Cadophora gregata TaxID=51156 RepID=UPI0026DCF19B|nr:uncharacterized protein ONS95_009195 [Cadophora gregata]KAK0124218.1 hypothetical protein ONS95_009195 [Cadophora gregata]